MRKTICCLFTSALAVFVFFISCKKETSCEECSEKNGPPIAIAGPDQVITLPTDSVLLDGSASSDPDGKISEWHWQKISGPASFNILNATSAKAFVKNLDTGIYRFEVNVKDNGGLLARDTVQVTVTREDPVNRPPVANAGKDSVITLPSNLVDLDGTASYDPENNISTYQWTKISGPSSFSIANSNAAQTRVTNLVEGVYQFELKVIDVGRLFDKDTVQIIVNAQLPTLPGCDNSNRPLVNAQLIPVGTLSQVRKDIAVASAGNKILFAGGGNYTDPNTYVVSSRVDIYDITTNSWSTAELSVGRTWIGAVAAGNKIFFAGGIIGGDDQNVVDIYDVSASTWSVSHMSRSVYYSAAATVGNKVFFAGGSNGIYATNTVDIYDLNSNTWSTASLSAARNFITAVSANNKVYFTGGDPWGAGPMSNVIDIYDNSTGTWSTTTLQVPRAYHAAIAANDVLYFVGGSTFSNQGGYTGTCSVETLNTNTGARTLMNLSSPASWSNAGRNAVVKDNKIIFLRPDRFDIYDTQSNTWSIGVLPQPIPQMTSVISVNNTIYVAGFVNGGLFEQLWKLEF
jgi:hypothetical protein